MIGALSNYTRSHFWKGDLKTTLYEDLKSNDPSMSKSHHGRKAMKTDLVEKPAGHCRTKGGLVAAPKYHVSKGRGKKKKKKKKTTGRPIFVDDVASSQINRHLGPKELLLSVVDKI